MRGRTRRESSGSTRTSSGLILRSSSATAPTTRAVTTIVSSIGKDRRRLDPPPTFSGRRGGQNGRYRMDSFAWTTAWVPRPLAVTGQTYHRYSPGVSVTVRP